MCRSCVTAFGTASVRGWGKAMAQISGMDGLLPNVDPASLPINSATEAIDVDLSSGRIDLWREPVLVQSIGCACSGIFCQCKFHPHKHKEDYLVRVGCDAILSGPCTLCPQYFCGDRAGKAIGYPAPVLEPVATVLEPVNDDCYTELRSYFYTYGNHCEEGAPSPAALSVKADKDTCVRVEVPPYVPDDCPYDVTTVRIYRTAAMGVLGNSASESPTGYLTPMNGGPVSNPEPPWTLDNNSETGCFMVAEIPIGDLPAAYEDKGDAIEADMGRFMTSEQACPPEKNSCIVGETSNGSLVGFFGNVVTFSERNEHWAWPYRNQICFEGECIRDVCVIRNSVLVTTNAKSYLVLDDSDCSGDIPRTVVESTTPTPGCSRSFCTREGAVFASRDGLYLMREEGQLTNLTKGIISKRDWECYGLCDMTLAEYCGQLFITMPGFSGVLIPGSANRTTQLSHLSICPNCWITDDSGELFFTFGGDLYQWDAGSEYMQGTWASGYWPMNYLPVGALMLDFSGISPKESWCEQAVVELFVDECLDACVQVGNCEPVRFGQCKGKYLQVRIRTRNPVRGVCFAATPAGLLAA